MYDHQNKTAPFSLTHSPPLSHHACSLLFREDAVLFRSRISSDGHVSPPPSRPAYFAAVTLGIGYLSYYLVERNRLPDDHPDSVFFPCLRGFIHSSH